MKTSIAAGMALAAVLAGLVGCATTSTRGDDPELRPRVYRGELELVFDQAVIALECLEWKIKGRTPAMGRIVASTPVSWRSWGESFTIQLSRTGEKAVKVEVVSKAKAQVVAWGKNKDNIIVFYLTLDSIHNSGSGGCPGS